MLDIIEALKPETITLLAIIVIIYLIHTFDAIETYIGVKWGLAKEVNPIMRQLFNTVGITDGLLFIQIVFGGTAAYAVINVLYADYYNWYASSGLPYYTIWYVGLVLLLVIRSVICVWNFGLMVGVRWRFWSPVEVKI